MTPQDENATEPFAQPLGIVSKIPSTKHDISLIYPPFSFFRLFHRSSLCSCYIPFFQLSAALLSHTVWGVSCSQTSWMEHSYFILIPLRTELMFLLPMAHHNFHLFRYSESKINEFRFRWNSSGEKKIWKIVFDPFFPTQPKKKNRQNFISSINRWPNRKFFHQKWKKYKNYKLIECLAVLHCNPA